MYVAEQDDDGLDRELWRCTQCPLHEACKKSRSFKNACCYSYIGEEECREYVKLHLLHSGIHRDECITEENANALAQSADISFEIETVEQRNEYRLAVTNRPQEPSLRSLKRQRGRL